MSGDQNVHRRAVLAGLWALAGSAGCSDPPLAAPRVPPSAATHMLELKMHVLVNRDRRDAGKPALAYDERLADTARAHADDMRSNHFFAHDSPTWGTLDDRLARAGISVATARENLAEAIDVDEAEKSLMKSPGHHENLMAEDVTHVGVGVVQGGVDHPEMLLFVQVFGRIVVQEQPSAAKVVVFEKISRVRAQKGVAPPKVNPVLEELATKYVQEISDEMGRSSLDAIGVKVLEDLKRRNATNLSVVVSGQRVVAASEYEPSQTMVEKPALEIGIGAAAAKDEKGRPAVKILVLVDA